MQVDWNGIERRIRSLTQRQRVLAGLAIVGVVAIAVYAVTSSRGAKTERGGVELSSQAKRNNRYYKPTDLEWTSLTVETVDTRTFRSENVTEGKIAVDEDRATPIFSPYSGRIIKLMAKPGDVVERGQPLFVVEATDTVQGLNDFMTAVTAANKAQSALKLAETVEKRARDLYEAKATPLRELQQAQADLTAAQNDARSTDTALEAARNRLRILGRTDAEISAFQEKGDISAATPISAPISGTVVQRKVGPGQYVSSGSGDPVFVIGDLNTVWLTAYIRETDASKVAVGQDMSFTVLAYPDKVYNAKINYIAASLDPNNRRLLVRATVDNQGGLLKPEMFATVSIYTDTEQNSVAVPREALIYEGSQVRIWIAREDKTIELRLIKTGLSSGRMVQVTEGLVPGERVITKGSLFIDRAAVGS